MYCCVSELTIYIPSTLHEIRIGVFELFSLHWSLFIFLVEFTICRCIISGIKRNAPTQTIQALSTEKVPVLDISSIFTIIPVVASLVTDIVSLQFILFGGSLFVYEIIAFKSGFYNPTMFFLRYKEYKILSTDNMTHRILTKKKIRRGNDRHDVIELNDIYIEV